MNYTTAFVKWKCRHCGKLEYWSTLSSGPMNTWAGCKKGPQGQGIMGRGGHSWVKMGVVQNKPKGK